MSKGMSGMEMEFKVGDLTLRGVRYCREGGVPAIALHGWLDNCGSFDSLALQLTNLDLLVLDLSGHGRSDHRSHIGAYNLWLDVAEVMEVARQLNWARFGIIGHSRGAMISLLVAGAFPEKITHFAAIESLFPWVGEAEEAPGQLAASIRDMTSAIARPKNYYSNMEKAIKARKNGLFEISYEDAKQLARRGVCKDDRGYYWASDSKLLASSEIRLSLAQVHAFMENIIAPIDFFVASSGLVNQYPDSLKELEKYPNINTHCFDGGHHFHMSEQTEAIAKVINVQFTYE